MMVRRPGDAGALPGTRNSVMPLRRRRPPEVRAATISRSATWPSSTKRLLPVEHDSRRRPSRPWWRCGSARGAGLPPAPVRTSARRPPAAADVRPSDRPLPARSSSVAPISAVRQQRRRGQRASRCLHHLRQARSCRSPCRRGPRAPGSRSSRAPPSRPKAGARSRRGHCCRAVCASAVIGLFSRKKSSAVSRTMPGVGGKDQGHGASNPAGQARAWR